MAHILHRDISDGNIIWHGEDGKAVGLLCDWDLSKPTNKLGKVVTQKDRSVGSELRVCSVGLMM